MKILFPNNIFAKFIAEVIKTKSDHQIEFKDTALCSSELLSGNYDAALIPSLDLIQHRDLFISSKIALIFDEILSTSYLYFVPNQNDFKDLYFTGDISSNELILSKILFKEKYATDISINLETSDINMSEKNYLLAGDKNFKESFYTKGLSFADEIASLLFMPYVNFVLASQNSKNLQILNNLIEDIDLQVEMNLSEVLKDHKLEIDAENFILENFGTVSYEVTDIEIAALKELLQLPYFHGIVDQIFEVNFI